jgi:hypothetical protein
VGNPTYITFANQKTGQVEGVVIGNVNQPIQLPDLTIPDGFALLLTADYNNTGIILVAFDPQYCVNPQKAQPLQPNQTMRLFVQYSNVIYISGNAPNDILHLASERGPRNGS